MKNKIVTALLSSAVFMTAMPASSEGVFLNSLLDTYEFHDIDPDFWTHQGQRAQTIVESGEHLGVAAAEGLHHAFDMGSKGKDERFLFASVVGFLEYQFQQANAIYFGHEYAHFQFRDYFGFQEHYFYDMEDQEEVEGTDLYVHLLFGRNPATAYNVGRFNGRDPEKEILVKSAGLSWQMNYSEEWVRRGLRSGGNQFFSFPGYLHNRAKTFSYAMSDKDTPENLSGDVEFMAHYYRNNLGLDASVDDIRFYSFISLLASPMTWNVVGSFGNYINTGSLKMEDPFFDAGPLRFTWDLPTYLNAENMTMVPTAYFDVGGYVIGTGVETPVIGDGDNEFTLSVGKNWENFFLEAEHTFASEGSHSEVQVGYNFNDHVGIEVRHVTSSGDSYRADRNNLYREDVTFAGVTVRF